MSLRVTKRQDIASLYTHTEWEKRNVYEHTGHIFHKVVRKRKRKKKGDNVSLGVDNAALYNSSYLAASATVRVHP